MPKGIKETSALIVVSAEVTQSAIDTYTFAEIDLQLDPLNNEVAVIYAIDLDMEEGDLNPGANTVMRGSLSTTERATSPGTIADSNVMAAERQVIQDNGVTAIATEFSSLSHTPTTLPYLGIIATPNFYLNLTSSGQASPKSMFAKVYLTRGRADSSIYAGLVQSELLS